MTDDIVAFIRARLDEDAERAKASRGYSPTPWRSIESGSDGGMILCDYDPNCSDPEEADTFVAGCEHRHDAEYISLVADPARVLRGVEAKRRIMDEHAPADFMAYGDHLCRRCVWSDEEAGKDELHHWVIYPCHTVRLLASEWSGHEDYRQDWAPDGA